MSLDTQMLEQTEKSSKRCADMISVQVVRNRAAQRGTCE